MEPDRELPARAEDAVWSTPDASGLNLSYAYGDSLIEQFVLSHRPADILKELIQNEYDAGGSRMSVRFGPSELLVTGNGAPIDRAGWRRLSVMLGTGHVTGSKRDATMIQPKTNGIGSKNFGMRSLFLLGNQVFVRSAGLWSVLDLDRGSQQSPSTDPSPRADDGAQIKVPFRTERHGRLESFDIDRERDVIASIASTLAPTLIKLADPTSRRSLHSLLLTSERCDRAIEWKQSAKIVPSPMKNVDIIRRSVAVLDRQAKETSKHRLEELEFRRSVTIPLELRDHAVPGYFRMSRGRIKLGLSLTTSRGRLRVGEAGTLFYPIGVPVSSGNGVGVCGPFEMNENRSDIVEPSLNPWNAWLLREAKDFALQILTEDWYQRFGPDAFAVLRPTSTGPAGFADRIVEELKIRECWPSRARQDKRRPTPKPVLVSSVILPEFGELDGFFSDIRYLDEQFTSNPRALSFAMECGATRFTIDSLIRLRCAGGNPSDLKTKTGPGATTLGYVGYPDVWATEDRQRRCSNALDARARQLTRLHKDDLTFAPTTLSAAGTLASPSGLWVIDTSISDELDLPLEQRLHPALAGSKVLRGLCKPFDRERWALDAARRAAAGAIEAREHETLFRFVIAEHRSLSPKARRELRKLPVLKDHVDRWVAPSSITSRRATGAARFGEVLHFSHPSYAKDPAIAKNLGFKKRVERADLIAFARAVEEHPELAADFEDTASKLKSMLTTAVLGELATVAFLRSSDGGIGRAASLYIRSEHSVACLGANAPYAAGDRNALYKLFGCREQPSSGDILLHLAQLREVSSRPPHPDALYPELVRAMRREQIPTRKSEDEPIVWTGAGYSRPVDTLVGAQHLRIFGSRVPIVAPKALALREAYEQLGASREASAAHWQQVVRWFAANRSDDGRRLPREEREILREAYAHIAVLPIDLNGAGRCLLADDGTLHSPAEILAKSFLLNDDPLMADMMKAGHIPIAFADDQSASSRRFFLGLGVSSLTKARKLLKTIVGEERPAPKWMPADTILGNIKTPEFASAVTAVAARELATSENPLLDSYRNISEMLRSIARIVIVNELQIEYQVGGYTVLVPTDAGVEDSAIILKRPASKSAVWDLVAHALATQLSDEEEHVRRLGDVLYRLLTCESPREMADQLKRKGIAWSPSAHDQSEAPDPDEWLAGIDDEEVVDAFDVMKERVIERLHAKGARPSEASGEILDEEAEDDEEDEERELVVPLPPLPDVTMSEVGIEDGWTPNSVRPRIREAARGWKPRSPEEQEADASVGRRGEELIFRHEKDRVRSLGFPAERVTWTASFDAGADHDIKSVDDDGGDLWIEVKSTTGRHGRFFWTISEFEKAVREGANYAIYRVYDAASENPVFAVVRDPIARLMRREMRLDIENLSAELPPQVTAKASWETNANVLRPDPSDSIG